MFRALQLFLRDNGAGRTLRPASTAFAVNGFSSTPSSHQRLAGKVEVITGGASGIGKATAAEFVRNGARVIIGARLRVNALSPHAVPTPLAMAAVAEWCPGRSVEERRMILERDINHEMVGHTLEAEDIARAAMYLASDDAKYVNGQNLVVDGGFTVNKQLNMPAAGR